MLERKKKEKMKTFLRYYLPLLTLFISINLGVAMIGDWGMYEIKVSPFLVICGIIIIIMALASIVALVVSGVKKHKLTSNSLVLGAVLAFDVYLFTETCIAGYFIKENPIFAVLAPLFIYIFYLAGGAIFKNPKVCYIALSVIFEAFGVLQYFVYAFRGAPIRAADINNVASAMEISSDYSVSAGYGPLIITLAVLNLGAVVAATVLTKLTPITKKPRLICGGASLLSFAVILLLSGRVFDYGVENRIIKFNFSGYEDLTSYRGSGNAYLFVLDLINSGSPEPDGYSDNKATDILSEYIQSTESERSPTVIAIMDESFADFARLGDLKTDIDYMPFYHSLKENAVKGFVTVSAYGGYSCNSEYEFLTGNSMGFFPMGSAAYTQYVKTKQDSLVSYFDSFGYDTVAMASCSPTLWNLRNAYNLIGFETQIYESQLIGSNPEYINGKLSDRTLFRDAISRFENKGDNPMFLFMTTMQNHASYAWLDDPAVELQGREHNTAEAYLSAIYETDKALEELITYFETVDEDVVIVFFGDHYPHIPSFSEELLGGGLGSLSTEQNARLHQTPFFIWANYDIEEQDGVEISLNYLSNKLIEVCGMPKTDFQQYLDTVMAEVPSISAFGYKGSDGKWYRAGEKSKYSDKLNEYNIVQYYRMFPKYGEE